MVEQLSGGRFFYARRGRILCTDGISQRGWIDMGLSFLSNSFSVDDGRMSDKNVGKRPKRRHHNGDSTNSDEWVPVQGVVLTSPGTISEMTRTSNRGKNDTRKKKDKVTMATADSLLESISDPVAAEEAYDRRAYMEAPGADDSDDDDSDNEMQEMSLDRAAHEEENMSALVNESDFVKSLSTATDEEIVMEGAPPGWKRPGVPEDWTATSGIKTGTKTPRFDRVDNPGGWSSYTYQPKYKKKPGNGNGYEYMYHASLAGATVVPKNKRGQREEHGWTFDYDGWDVDGIPRYRSGATKENMFPDCRKGCLDGDVLKLLGMSAERMLQDDGAPDALFFYQLLFPIVNPNNSGIPNDPRKAFYSQVSLFTNLYAVGELQLGNGMGHKWINTDGPELLRWDGVTFKDGVLGGSNGAILRRFDTRKDNASFDADIYNAMYKTRWLELKRTVKLCNNLTSPKRGEVGYDPAYKYDMIYDVLVHNTNAITKYAGLDLCGDETSWAHQGFAEGGTGIVGPVVGKPGVCKGGQTVLVSDTDHIRPRAYVHRHKCHQKKFNIAGQNEVHMIWEKIKRLVVDEEDRENVNPLLSVRPIFREKPHFTWDNYFSGQAIMDYAAEEGFGMTSTCRRDRLPQGVPGKYFHKEATGTNARSRHSRFENPIFLWNRRENGSILQHCSFQSTGPTNISSVNALNGCHLYASTKERGRSMRKFKWAIEMNEPRELYLGTYGMIDTIDHYIKNCCLGYR